ncbi:MAG: carbohydrate ABC transporter substrate-binding protein [Rhodanobacter sp.]|nr:MAG: carbohydrate ABC transporter substrate-binding protein [Rhodanobacter sp.]TAM42787.1 MAG: carbohydrate ABC transporter substrate-binding protein [Rhodanobacter sp.]
MRSGKLLKSGVLACMAAAMLTMATNAAAADKGEISVLNWWTSGSEAKSMGVLQQMMAKEGYKMNNDAVSGGGGTNARTVLKSRLSSDNVPGAAQIKGPEIQQWCEQGVTTNIDAVAKADHWDKLLAPAIAKGMQCGGHWVAVPFDNHRVNWLWINRADIKKVDAQMPQSWDELVSTMKKLKAAGITPIAGGGDTWQIGTEFDALVAGVGGADFYRKAFVDLDKSALDSPTMAKAFEHLRVIKEYSDPNGSGLAWNHDTGMVVKGTAAMQIMGDWAKGEIANDGATPGKEVACVAFPGSQGTFIYNIDSFEMFKVKTASERAAQATFARTAMSPEFQRKFNMVKGSIPVREGTSLTGFDECAKASEHDYKDAAKKNGLVPSMSQDMAEVGAIKGAIFDVVARFYNSDKMTSQEAATELAKQVEQAKQMTQM